MIRPKIDVDTCGFHIDKVGREMFGMEYSNHQHCLYGLVLDFHASNGSRTYAHNDLI
jgi:hypothetical protein